MEGGEEGNGLVNRARFHHFNAVKGKEKGKELTFNGNQKNTVSKK